MQVYESNYTLSRTRSQNRECAVYYLIIHRVFSFLSADSGVRAGRSYRQVGPTQKVISSLHGRAVKKITMFDAHIKQLHLGLQK
jgi:hypothetical protein